MKPQATLDPKTMKAPFAALTRQNNLHVRRYPGDAFGRQPVHTVYGGAHLFKSDTAKKLGELALGALSRYGADPITFARAIGTDEGLALKVYDRVVEKLTREAVEDFRIDFEDGFGYRSDDEEDRTAAACVAAWSRPARSPRPSRALSAFRRAPAIIRAFTLDGFCTPAAS